MKHSSSWLTGAIVVVGAGLGGGVGCGDVGSLGPYDGSSSSEGDGGTEGASVSASGTSASGTWVSGTASAASDTETTTAPDSSGFVTQFTASVSETGETDTSVSACEQPGNCAMLPAPCGESCGDVVSAFDAEGCLRAECDDDEACGGDERCFRGLDYGLCQASGVSCEDSPEDDACVCTSNPDCGGGHCVPAALIPEIELEPDISGGILSTGCSPNDALSLVLTIYGDGGQGDCVIADDSTVELQFEFYDAEPEIGTYEFTADSGGVGFHRGEGGVIEGLQLGRLVIDAIDVEAGTVSGTYEAVVMQDGALRVFGGELDELAGGGAPYCPAESPCG